MQMNTENNNKVISLTAPTSLLSSPMPNATVATTFRKNISYQWQKLKRGNTKKTRISPVCCIGKLN